MDDNKPMQETQLAISEWEKHTGRFLKDDTDVSEIVTLTQFNQIATLNNTIGVAYEDRVQFLEDNGYEVSRENLINPELSARRKDTDHAN